MGIKIITDSACDLPKSLAEELGVEVLPIVVYINEKEYLDGVTIQTDEFYEEMKKGSIVKTAQIPLAYFVERFESYANSEDYFVYLAFSSVLSGTYQTALLAYENVKEKYPDFKMSILDTKSVSLGLGVLVAETAMLVKDGASLEEVINYVAKHSIHMEHVFSVDNLEYLFRGGRVSKSQAFIGNVLNIKPILHVVDGALVPFEKVKGKKKVLSAFFDYIAKYGKDLDQQIVGIAHALNEQDAKIVQEHFETVYGTKKFIVNQLGCAIGAHCGPGLITLFFKNEV